MNPSFLSSLTEYSRLVAELFNNSSVKRSTVAVWSESPYTGIAEGKVFFSNGLRLRMREEIDFDAHLIVSYGYEVYKGDERLTGTMIFPTRMILPSPQRFPITSMFPQHQTSSRTCRVSEL